jgi:hypothetical protein
VLLLDGNTPVGSIKKVRNEKAEDGMWFCGSNMPAKVCVLIKFLLEAWKAEYNQAKTGSVLMSAVFSIFRSHGKILQIDAQGM